MKEQSAVDGTSGHADNERERIRTVYARRATGIDPRRYSLFNHYALYTTQERERALLGLLRKVGVSSLEGMRIVDLGSGDGGLLRRLVDYGAEPSLTLGIDLLPERVKKARAKNPSIPVLCGNGSVLPFPDGSFDIAMQFTVFTSVLDGSCRRAMAQELLRVLRPQGKVIWYDFIYNNPRNPDVRGIGKWEIRSLFPGCRFRFRRVTLAPPLGRSLPPFVLLYDFLSLFRLFSSHYLCIIEKP